MHLDVALLLFLLVLGALVVPLLAPRIGVPEAVGQIAYGVIIGLFGVAGDHEVLRLLAELGFILLMFGAGLEIDFDAVERGGKAGLLAGLGVAVGFLGVSVLLVLVAGLAPFYVVVLSACSIGLAVAVLRETGLASAPVGQAILLVGSIGEFLTLGVITVYDIAAVFGLSWQMVIELGKLLALVVAGGVFLRWLRAWSWWHPGVFRRVFEEHDASEIGVRAALVACLAFVALAVWLHIEPILGAFIAGAVSRMVFRDVRVLEQKMSALSSGFFIPIFFVAVGVEFDLAQLSVSGLKTAVFLGMLVVLARLLPCAALLGAGNSPRDILGVSLLLGAPLTLLVAIARLGRKLDRIDEAEASAIVLLAILLSVVLPIGFRWLYREADS